MESSLKIPKTNSSTTGIVESSNTDSSTTDITLTPEEKQRLNNFSLFEETNPEKNSSKPSEEIQKEEQNKTKETHNDSLDETSLTNLIPSAPPIDPDEEQLSETEFNKKIEYPGISEDFEPTVPPTEEKKDLQSTSNSDSNELEPNQENIYPPVTEDPKPEPSTEEISLEVPKQPGPSEESTKIKLSDLFNSVKVDPQNWDSAEQIANDISTKGGFRIDLTRFEELSGKKEPSEILTLAYSLYSALIKHNCHSGTTKLSATIGDAWGYLAHAAEQLDQEPPEVTQSLKLLYFLIETQLQGYRVSVDLRSNIPTTRKFTGGWRSVLSGEQSRKHGQRDEYLKEYRIKYPKVEVILKEYNNFTYFFTNSDYFSFNYFAKVFAALESHEIDLAKKELSVNEEKLVPTIMVRHLRMGAINRLPTPREQISLLSSLLSADLVDVLDSSKSAYTKRYRFKLDLTNLWDSSIRGYIQEILHTLSQSNSFNKLDQICNELLRNPKIGESFNYAVYLGKLLRGETINDDLKILGDGNIGEEKRAILQILFDPDWEFKIPGISETAKKIVSDLLKRDGEVSTYDLIHGLCIHPSIDSFALGRRWFRYINARKSRGSVSPTLLNDPLNNARLLFNSGRKKEEDLFNALEGLVKDNTQPETLSEVFDMIRKIKEGDKIINSNKYPALRSAYRIIAGWAKKGPDPIALIEQTLMLKVSGVLDEDFKNMLERFSDSEELNYPIENTDFLTPELKKNLKKALNSFDINGLELSEKARIGWDLLKDTFDENSSLPGYDEATSDSKNNYELDFGDLDFPNQEDQGPQQPFQIKKG